MKKKTLRIIRRIFGKSQNPPSFTGEAPSDFYDDTYTRTEEYFKHYTQSRYYFLWSVILDRTLRISKNARVLEIGCGPGQLAQMLTENDIESYRGFDFSSQAIELANRKSLKNANFHVGDAYSDPLLLQSASNFDLVICTEVLEHIERDLEVLGRLEVGTRFIATVPNFPYVSHVRHFLTADSVYERYSPYFTNFTVIGLRQPMPSKNVYWLFEGIVENRNPKG